MKLLKILSILLMINLVTLTTAVYSAEAAPEAVIKLADELKSWGTNSTIIEAVKNQNSKAMTLASIKEMDSKWRNVSGLNDEMKALMENSAAKEMLKMESSKAFYFEVFLMDNQGANVAMTNKTSDYWQGDEAKFIESYKDGNGAIHIGDVEFDESAQAYLVQVSIPVMDGGKAIGAMTIGVNVDELEN